MGFHRFFKRGTKIKIEILFYLYIASPVRHIHCYTFTVLKAYQFDFRLSDPSTTSLLTMDTITAVVYTAQNSYGPIETGDGFTTISHGNELHIRFPRPEDGVNNAALIDKIRELGKKYRQLYGTDARDEGDDCIEVCDNTNDSWFFVQTTLESTKAYKEYMDKMSNHKPDKEMADMEDWLVAQGHLPEAEEEEEEDEADWYYGPDPAEQPLPLISDPRDKPAAGPFCDRCHYECGKQLYTGETGHEICCSEECVDMLPKGFYAAKMYNEEIRDLFHYSTIRKTKGFDLEMATSFSYDTTCYIVGKTLAELGVMCDFNGISSEYIVKPGSPKNKSSYYSIHVLAGDSPLSAFIRFSIKKNTNIAAYNLQRDEILKKVRTH